MQPTINQNQYVQVIQTLQNIILFKRALLSHTNQEIKNLEKEIEYIKTQADLEQNKDQLTGPSEALTVMPTAAASCWSR